MISINKTSSSSVIDFAAEELKKYFYMMMPSMSDVEISYLPSADAGFRLGLMKDLHLDFFDAQDPTLDDIIYIDCTECGGIIAGSNPRAVLIAVYEYLRRNGCRWLFPGIDGEYIPIKGLNPVKYRHLASMRFRGPCIEGAISQQILLETIEFLPKVGMNTFCMQFFVPTPFFKNYYDHYNSKIRAAESVTSDNILQWKRAAEAEMAKRGIQFNDVGHGWSAAPFGIDCSSAWDSIDESIVPKDSFKYLAEVGGRRGLYKSRVLTTQFCMSNEVAQNKIVSYVVDYARAHLNLDYLLFSLADNYNNHCECAACAKKSVSDWYVILLNKLDRALTEAKLKTRIVFSNYTETAWAPISEKIENPERFTLEIAPITRSYTVSLTGKKCQTMPFVRNKITLPKSLDEYIAYYKLWSRAFKGDGVVFEYHFWKHQVFDLSGQKLALRIFEDIEAYESLGFRGIYACGSQRSYFPNGYAYYVFARKLFDTSLTLDEIKTDYYSHAYGEDWKNFYDYLSEIEELISFGYLEGEESENAAKSPFFSLRRADEILKTPKIIKNGRELIHSHFTSEVRVRTVSVRILDEHAGYVERLARALYHKALGNDEAAIREMADVLDYISSHEPYLERYTDMNMTAGYIKEIIYSKGTSSASVLNL